MENGKTKKNLHGETNFLELARKPAGHVVLMENKQWYERHHDEHREAVEQRKARDREAAQKFVYEYLSYRKCVDCGEYDFSVLTFDYIRGKKKEISRMIVDGDFIRAIMDEIAKCEVVCSNCHMRPENKRRSGGRFRKFWPKFPWEE